MEMGFFTNRTWRLPATCQGLGEGSACGRRLEPASCRAMMLASAITICLTPPARRILVLRVPQLSAQSPARKVGCFLSHYAVWHHMVEKNISTALILEDDFDVQEDFRERLGHMGCVQLRLLDA